MIQFVSSLANYVCVFDHVCAQNVLPLCVRVLVLFPARCGKVLGKENVISLSENNIYYVIICSPAYMG